MTEIMIDGLAWPSGRVMAASWLSQEPSTLSTTSQPWLTGLRRTTMRVFPMPAATPDIAAQARARQMVGGTDLPGNRSLNCLAYWRLPTRRQSTFTERGMPA